MDEMKDYELQLFEHMVHWAYKNDNELARLIMYNNTAVHAKKGTFKKKLSEFWPLPTDEDHINYHRLEGEELKTARERIQKAFNKKRKI